MPSNAMKISQMVEHLQAEMATHGDLDVVMTVLADDAIVAIDGRNINVAGELLARKMPNPVLVLGLWRDEQGRLRNSPGAVYQASADASDWTYDRSLAPENIDLKVWKRYGGPDVGRREGDKWFVREGTPEWPRRPVEIIPAGILGWAPL